MKRRSIRKIIAGLFCHCWMENKRGRMRASIWDIARAFQVRRIKVQCSWDERFVRGRQSESNAIFDRAEATQRLSRGGRIRSRCMVSDATHDTGLSVF